MEAIAFFLATNYTNRHQYFSAILFVSIRAFVAIAYQLSVLKLLAGNPSVLNRSPTTKSLNA